MFLKWIFKTRDREIYHDIIDSLVTALEAKDNYTSGHSERVAAMTYELAKGLGIKGLQLENIDIAAHLHDIGKNYRLLLTESIWLTSVGIILGIPCARWLIDYMISFMGDTFDMI